MIRKTFYISLSFLFINATISWGQINHRVTFSKDFSIIEKELDDGNTYSRIIFPDSQSTDSIGYPKLPVKYINLIIPVDQTVTGITIIKGEYEKVKLGSSIEPFQPPVPTTVNYQFAEFVKPDKIVYQSDVPFPANLAKMVHQGKFRDNSIVSIAIFPFQYIPAKNELLYYWIFR